ncbi:MAG: ribosomal L7Ae/L30e/S12e/Gadd45 family protein [Clostridia bacterium]|nr:ribosomal L7Ae/L30e/S12e/Gadd45 family protein [Clostridia bacterium]
MSDEKKLLGVIGMCRGAGKAVIGTDMVCEYLRKTLEKKARRSDEVDVIVIEASDTSENTHKKISDKCVYYNVKHIRLASTCEILGKAVGKRATAAVAIADKNFCRAVLGKINESENMQ